MNHTLTHLVEQAKAAALEVLLHNAHGPYGGLPRAAGWGYPEPYTRDIMISALGMLVSGNEDLVAVLHRSLETCARHQTRLGHIPSLVHDRENRGSSDTTPLFLLATACFRRATGEEDFLDEAVRKALAWMEYQSPSDRYLVAQLPTSDWRDEQWVLGFGLFVNTLVYSYLRLYGLDEQARAVRGLMGRFTIEGGVQSPRTHEGFAVRYKPYYALWSYKVHSSDRFDLLGNSLAILSGIAPPSRADAIVSWIERECAALRHEEQLAVDLPPNFFPYILPEDPDWRPRYAEYNRPGEYHNGGIWPFVCGFYVAALIAAGRFRLAEKRFAALTKLVTHARDPSLAFGFNEWFRAQDGAVMGQDWQTWSAGMYLYAAECVRTRATPFFDRAREGTGRASGSSTSA